MAVNKEKALAAAQKFVEKGQFDKAVKEYLKVTAEDPKDVRVLLKLGDTYAKNGDKAEATDTYLKVAAIYSEQGFFQKAVAVFKQVLRLDPRLVDVNFKLADLYRQLGLMSDAMQQYELASNFLHREGRVKEALDALRHMVDLEPDNVASRIKLAEAYSKDGNTQEAIGEFAHAADALRETNRTDDFIKVAERLVFHQPDNNAVQLELAELYLKRNDPKRALPKLQVCFKADPRDLRVLGLLADAFEQLGQLGKTISVLKETARIHGENGNPAGRDATFRRVLQLAPGDNEALQALQPSQTGLRSAPSGRVALPSEPSIQPLSDEDLVEATPEPLEPEVSGPLIEAEGGDLASLVDEYPAAGEETPAVDAMESSSLIDAEIEPGVEEDVAEEVVRILTETDVYIKYGLYDKALEHVRRVFEIAPSNLEAREKLKDLYLQVGDVPEAIAELLVLARATAAERPADAMAYCRQVLELEADNEPALNLVRRLQSQPVAVGVPAAPLRAPPPLARPDLDRTADDHGKGEIDVEVDSGQFDVAGEELAEVEAFDDGVPTPRPADGDKSASAEVLFEFDEENGAITGESAALDLAADEPSGLVGGPVRRAVEPVPGTPRVDVGFDADMAAIEEVEPPDLTGAQDGDVQYPRALPNEPTRAFADPLARRLEPEAEPNDDALLSNTAAAPAPPPKAMGPAPPMTRPAPARVAPPLEPPTRPERVAAPAPARVATPAPAPPPAPEAPTEGIEDDLDQAEFMVQQELFDDAREVLKGVLDRHPGHPLVLAKLREIDEAEQALTGAAPAAAAPPPPAPSPPPAPPPAPAPAAPAKPMFPPPAASAPSPPAPPAPAPRASVAVPIPAAPSAPAAGSGMRRMPDQPIDLKDFETHYDLGIAYKEMGLYNDAIREFEMIAQAPGREVLCHTMIGLCFSARGMLSEAISQFKKGLYVEGITDQETISLYYELGQCYEKLGDPREALYYYEKVAKRDPRFRDVQRRVEEVKKRPSGEGSGAGGS